MTAAPLLLPQPINVRAQVCAVPAAALLLADRAVAFDFACAIERAPFAPAAAA
jgi:hypothetical protein